MRIINVNKQELEKIAKTIDNNKLDDIYLKYNPGRYKKGYKPHQYIRIHLLYSFKGFKSFNELHKNLKDQNRPEPHHQTHLQTR